MENPLDRPVWSALNGLQSDLSEGGRLARRYKPDVNLFACVGADTPQSLEALSGLVGEGEQIILLQKPEPLWDGQLKPKLISQGFQMVAGTLPPRPDDLDIHSLSDADVSEMIALAHLTEPGPFLPKTHTMGQFYGIRLDGRLAAMAGQRFRFEGYCEVSGVCTHPDFRGRGLANRLSAHLTHVIADRGETPFLHGWLTNEAAIRVYERLGYKRRTIFNIAVLERA